MEYLRRAVGRGQHGAGLAGPTAASVIRRVPIWLGVVAALVLVDAFHTSGQLGQWRAVLFWTALVGLNVAGWMVWCLAAGTAAASGARLLLGAGLLNGLLTLEVPLLYRALGRAEAALDWRPFAYGLLATGLIVYVRRLRPFAVAHEPAEGRSSDPDTAAVPVPPAPVPVPDILARAGIADAAELMMVRAEDHYCRLLLRGGRMLLVHYRFGDAVRDLGVVDGERVHRGAWVAADAVVGARREGRRWWLELRDGTRVPVSETGAALARARGWLRIGGSA